MTLEHTQIGDQVVVANHHNKTIKTVTHTTKTQVYVGSTKFRRNGTQIGGSKWSSYSARPATEEDITENERRLLADNLRRVDYSTLSLDQLRRIRQITKE
jgi:hypothetical protein